MSRYKMVDHYFMAYVGGKGERIDIESALEEAIEMYNRHHPGTDLVIEF